MEDDHGRFHLFDLGTGYAKQRAREDRAEPPVNTEAGRGCAVRPLTHEAFLFSWQFVCLFFVEQAEAGGREPKEARAGRTGAGGTKTEKAEANRSRRSRRKRPRHTRIRFAVPVFPFVSRALMESRGSELRAPAAPKVLGCLNCGHGCRGDHTGIEVQNVAAIFRIYDSTTDRALFCGRPQNRPPVCGLTL